MILNTGNIIKKSKLLKYYIFDDNKCNENIDNIYDEYNLKLSIIPGINKYKLIEKDLHDAIIENVHYNSNYDIIFDLKLYSNDTNVEYKKSLLFKNARIISYNKVLKSGNISNINKNIVPREYLYDEIYNFDGNNYITIIFVPRTRVKSGYYYPMMTIRFKVIDVID